MKPCFAVRNPIQNVIVNFCPVGKACRHTWSGWTVCYGNAVLCGKCFYLCFCHMTRCKRADDTIFSQRFSPRPVDMKVILICSVEYLGDTVIAGKFQKFPK